jgi:Clp amino terminal domain, pathogenicity island component
MTELPDLDRLIAAVAERGATDEPLARLAAAAGARDELEALTEALLDHFIDEARAAGCSWSQIGSVLGVSKQAAQQRHTAMQSVARQLLSRLSERPRSGRAFFTRFSPGARAAVALAQGAARRLRHHHIGTEHLLLGLLGEGNGLAAQALAEVGVTEAAAESAVVEEIGYGEDDGPGHIPFTPRSKKVLELSLREALRLGDSQIGTEHVLLGLLREGEGMAITVLERLGVDGDRLRAAVTRLLGDAA